VTIPDRVTRIDGQACREFRIRLPSGLFDSYWLDADRGYLTCRIRRYRTFLIEVVDLQYRDHAASGWALAGWTARQQRGDGTVVNEARAEVTDLRVGEPAPADTFRLDPLPGDTVSDQESGKTFLVGRTGELEPVSPDGRVERSTNSLWSARVLAPVLLVGAVVAGVGAAVWLRRRRRAHTPSQ
jgi:hypothetical protein